MLEARKYPYAFFTLPSLLVYDNDQLTMSTGQSQVILARLRPVLRELEL